jgi:hypothetical protein
MKLRLTREIHFLDGRVLHKEAIGEPILLFWDGHEQTSKIDQVEMLFYGYPGLYTVAAGDLENL